MMNNAMRIDRKDNVAVAIEAIASGDPVRLGDDVQFTARQDLPIYHKVAVEDIKKGEPVVKYGEHIGVAGTEIKAGDHVHTHNVENCREEL